MDIADNLADMDLNNNEVNNHDVVVSAEYDNFRVAIESCDNVPKPEELKTKIMEEFEARNRQKLNINNDPE